MLPAPSSTGVDTVGPPVGVVTQFEVNVAPSKSTECTVAFRLKMIVSVLLVRSSSAAAAPPEYRPPAPTTSEPAERVTVTVVEAPATTFALQISVRAVVLFLETSRL